MKLQSSTVDLIRKFHRVWDYDCEVVQARETPKIAQMGTAADVVDCAALCTCFADSAEPPAQGQVELSFPPSLPLFLSLITSCSNRIGSFNAFKGII